MADSFRDHLMDDLMDDLEYDLRRKISNYIIGMIPKPVRKIVGWILLIFGAVALLTLYPGSLFYTMSELMFMITFAVVIISISLGISLLRHKG